MNLLNSQTTLSHVSTVIPQSLIVVDKILDFIPFGSTANNIIDLGLKHFAFQDENAVNQSAFKDYIEHLKSKKTSNCMIYSIPFIGNAVKMGQVALDFFSLSPNEPDHHFYPFPPVRDEKLSEERKANSIENIAW